MAAQALRWALVSGPKGGGKAAMVSAVLAELRARGAAVAGFRQVRAGEDGHALERLSTGQQQPLARKPGTPRDGEEPFCSRLFWMPAFEVARGWFEADAPGAEVLLVDEVSKLEAGRRGHHGTLAWAFEHAGERPLVLGVRADQLFEVMSALGLEHEPIASLEGEAGGEAVRAFVGALLR